MTVTKAHIAIGFSILTVIGLTLLLIYWYQRRRDKTVGDIQTVVKINTKPITESSILALPGTPLMYGSQVVQKDAYGIWRIPTGICELTEAGIIDWAYVKNMPQLEKDTLYNDMGKCNFNNLPLYQPA